SPSVPAIFLPNIPLPPIYTLFPYTTLFRSSFKHNEDGTIKKLLSNLRVMLQRHPKAKDLKFNEFSQEVTLKGVPVTDSFLIDLRSEEHTSELQSRFDIVCRLLLEKKNINEDLGELDRTLPKTELVVAISNLEHKRNQSKHSNVVKKKLAHDILTNARKYGDNRTTR